MATHLEFHANTVDDCDICLRSYFWTNHNIALKVATNEWEKDLKLLLLILLGFANHFNIDLISGIRPSTPFSILVERMHDADDIYIMMKCLSVCVCVTKNHHFPLLS